MIEGSSFFRYRLLGSVAHITENILCIPPRSFLPRASAARAMSSLPAVAKAKPVS